MNDQIVQFGKNRELVGLISKPENVSLKSGKTAVISLNAGLLHRVGFNRFSTDLSRLLAQRGYTSLRFDFHGLGDSAAYDGSIPYDDQVLVDAKASIDLLLQGSHAEQCVLIGLCSGADYAHFIALSDPRVAGVILLDGYAYPTLGFYIRDYMPGIFNPQKIARFCIKKIKKNLPHQKISVFSDTSNEFQKEIYLRTFPPKKQIIRELKQLTNRGTYMNFIYSGGVPQYYNYQQQFTDMFRFAKFCNKISCSYIKEADHTYTVLSIRKRLFTCIIDWIESIFH